MPRNRWLAVALAVAFIGLVEIIVDSVLDLFVGLPWRTLIVTAVICAAAGVSAWFAFGRIEGLRHDLLERNADLESRNEALRAVHEASLYVADQADPERTINAIVEHTRRLFHVDAAILVLDTSNGFLRLRAASAADGVLEPASDEESPPTYDELGCFLQTGYKIRAIAPVKHGDHRLGTLALACGSACRLEDKDRETLAALATQVGMAIEAARIQDELQELAVQRERERIARDMHDGLAQVLGYVNTKSQAVSLLLDQGRIDEARKQLGELEQAARSVFTDVREAILNLSGSMPSEHGVAGALEQYAVQFGESAAVAVRFEATPDAAAAPLSAAAQAEVFSIAREALTNVRKHAHAEDVEIGMRRQNTEVILTIKDNGVGFEAELLAAGREHWPHFGLAGMRERAESIGGRIEWHSRPGAGTEVELHVPVGGTTRHHALERSTPLHETQGMKVPHQAVRSSTPAGSEAD